MATTRDISTERLFTPGDGAVPPALAGRKTHQDMLSLCLADLAGERSPPHNVVLVGPRGNGKTALLNWFKRECQHRGVDAVALTPRDIADPEQLAAALVRPSLWRRLAPRKVAVAAVGALEWRVSENAATHPAGPLARRLAARCRKRPVALLLDEAHTLAPAVGGLLLNASAQVRDEAPFLLVLAGTPGLAATLARTDASFWNRLGSGRLGVGLLSSEAAAEALEAPLRQRDVCVTKDALASVVEAAQRYPYFLQLWGEALWQQRPATGSGRLTETHVEAARPPVAARIAEYYQDRFRELEAGGLLPAAVAVAPLFSESSSADTPATATDHAIDAALAAAHDDGEQRLAAREALHRLGYIWCPPAQAPPIAWQAGIPSLTAYVQYRAAGNEGGT